MLDLMLKSRDTLKNHPVNRARSDKGKKIVTSVWLWGQGEKPAMEPITKKFNLRGGMISAVDLLNGLGIYAGLETLKVEGATGDIDTNYVGKAEKALEALREKDFVLFTVEAPDEMGHEGNAEGKVKAIEDFDEEFIGDDPERDRRHRRFQGACAERSPGHRSRKGPTSPIPAPLPFYHRMLRTI